MTQSTIRFDLQTHLQSGLERMEGLKEELQAALGALGVRLRGGQGQWSLEVEPDEEDVPVALLDLLEEMAAPEGLTAVLGLALDDRPVLIDLATDSAAHVLVAGDAQAGKSSLLRTLAVSLALTRRQSELQLLLFDGGAAAKDVPSSRFRPLEYLPHVLGPAIDSVEEAQEVLAFLAQEVTYRREQHVQDPAIVVLIDDVVALAQAARSPVSAALATLLQQGAAAGVHLVMSAESSLRPVLGSLLDARLPVRLVGWVADSAAARDATGVSDSQAENLYGAGDFVAVSQGQVTNFQAAYVSNYDLHYVLEQLHRRPGRPLLAQPFDPRPRGGPLPVPTEHSFIFDAVRHVVDLDDLPPRPGQVRRTIDVEAHDGVVVFERAQREGAGEKDNGFVGRRPTLYASERAPAQPLARGPGARPLPDESQSDSVASVRRRRAPVADEAVDVAPEAVVEERDELNPDAEDPVESPAVAELEYVDVDENSFPDPDDEADEPERRPDPPSARARAAPRPRPRPAPRREAKKRAPSPGAGTDDDVIPFE